MATSPTANCDSTEVIACKLTGHETHIRIERWRRLGREAGLARVETRDGLDLRFRDEPATERELRALVAAERECCAWAQWEIRSANGELTMHVSAAPPGVTTLHSMFAAGSCGDGKPD